MSGGNPTLSKNSFLDPNKKTPSSAMSEAARGQYKKQKQEPDVQAADIGQKGADQALKKASIGEAQYKSWVADNIDMKYAELSAKVADVMNVGGKAYLSFAQNRADLISAMRSGDTKGVGDRLKAMSSSVYPADKSSWDQFAKKLKLEVIDNAATWKGLGPDQREARIHSLMEELRSQVRTNGYVVVDFFREMFGDVMSMVKEFATTFKSAARDINFNPSREARSAEGKIIDYARDYPDEAGKMLWFVKLEQDPALEKMSDEQREAWGAAYMQSLEQQKKLLDAIRTKPETDRERQEVFTDRFCKLFDGIYTTMKGLDNKDVTDTIRMAWQQYGPMLKSEAQRVKDVGQKIRPAEPDATPQG